MMEPAENWPCGELAESSDRPMGRRIFIRGQMRSEFVVITGVGRQDPAQMGLAEDDDVIEAFPAEPTSLSACPFCQGDLGAIG
jgi:hypothetical protein